MGTGPPLLSRCCVLVSAVSSVVAAFAECYEVRGLQYQIGPFDLRLLMMYLGGWHAASEHRAAVPAIRILPQVCGADVLCLARAPYLVVLAGRWLESHVHLTEPLLGGLA